MRVFIPRKSWAPIDRYVLDPDRGRLFAGEEEIALGLERRSRSWSI